MSHPDVLVLGTGGVGTAALFHLARRGARVVGIDRFPPGHDRGSSHGVTRVIRMAYFEHPHYVPLLARAFDLWAELGQMIGRRLLVQTGLLQIGPPSGEVVAGVLRSAREHGLAVEPLPPDTVAQRFPGFHVPEGMAAVLEERAGLLLVEDCVRAHAELAHRQGATLVAREEVRSFTTGPAGVRVTTDRSTYEAGNLVVTPGPWAPDLLADLVLEGRTALPIEFLACDRPCPVRED